MNGIAIQIYKHDTIQIYLFLYCLYFFLRVNAQDTLTHNLLWEIKHPNQKQSSYLFGTIHLIPTEDFLSKNTLEKMSLCEKVFLKSMLKNE